MLNIGPQELLLILVIALIVVGPTRLPELGRSLGKGLREIRKAQDDVKRTIQLNLDDEPSAKTRPRPTGKQASGAAEQGAVSPAVEPDPTPLAGEPVAETEVKEISRTLGRSLAELRRAREAVQRGFRVDLDEPSPRDRKPTGPAASGTPDADTGSSGAEAGSAAPDESPSG